MESYEVYLSTLNARRYLEYSRNQYTYVITVIMLLEMPSYLLPNNVYVAGVCMKRSKCYIYVYNTKNRNNIILLKFNNAIRSMAF